jgi:hypothetical protein
VPWLAKNRATLSAKQYSDYDNQHKCITRICTIYETSALTEKEQAKQALEVMQEVGDRAVLWLPFMCVDAGVWSAAARARTDHGYVSMYVCLYVYASVSVCLSYCELARDILRVQRLTSYV